MQSANRVRSRAVVVVLAALVLARPAGATETRDRVVLDSVVKDLGISLLSKPETTMLKLPLALGNWSLFERLQPYASLGPRVQTQVEEPTGLSAPLRETDDFAKGVGVGAGLSWHLTDRLELFGEYQLLNMGGRDARSEGTLGRRDLETPGVKGGFSIRF
jgi:hypothetical protein